MTQISVISKESHTLLNQVDSNNVSLTENSVVVIKAPKEDVASITRSGDHAIINLKNGESIVVENYFNAASSDNSLVFEGQDGSLYWAKFTDSTGAIADVIQYQPLAEIEPLLYKDSLTGVILPWALGAGGAGLIGAAASNGSDDKDKETPAPAVPSKLTAFEVADNQAPKVGKISAGAVTNDQTPVVSGLGAEAGADIKVYDGGQLIASTTAQADGTWSVEVAKDLTDGAHSISVSQTVKGVEGPKSDALDFTIDTKDPNVTIDPLAPTGDNTPTIGGETDSGAQIEVVIKDKNGNIVDKGPGVVDGNGGWTYTPSKPLPEGPLTVEVTAKDPAGNDKTVTDTGLTVDTTLPAVSIEALKPTNDVTPDIKGKTEAGATVKVEIKDAAGNVVDSGNATVDSSGNWTYTPTKTLPEGAYKVEATATDPAGNKGSATDSGLSVDLTPPVVSINPLAPTNDATPAVTGKTEAGSTVEVAVKDQAGKTVESGPATVDGSGNWSYTPANSLPDSGYTVEATAKDPAGNKGVATDTGLVVDTAGLTVTIDPLKPTNDTTPDITGNTASNAVVTVVIKDASGATINTGTATTDSSGKWSYTAGTLPEGTYTVDATAKLPSGTTANATANGLIVDTTLPTVSVHPLALTNDATPTISGKTESGASVHVQVKDASGAVVSAGDAIVDASGNWTYAPASDLPDGSYTAEAVAKDTAGNTASASNGGLTVDTTPPAVTIEPLAITNAVAPVIKGTMEAGSAVTVVVKDDTGKTVASGSAQIDSNNEWSFVPSPALADGKYTVEAVAKDPAGNASNAAADSGLEIDTIPPTVDIDNLFGAAAARMLMSTASTTLPQTNQIKPTFSGSSTKSTEVMIYLQDESGKNVDSGLAKLDTATGKWTFTPSHDLAEGYYMLQAISKDAAGNQSAPAAKAFIVDIQAPVVEVDDVGLTNDATPELKGKVNEPTATVTVEVKDAAGKVIETGTATVASDGKWNYTVKAALPDGSYQVTASARDKAGNIGAEDTGTAQVDTVVPTSTLTVSPTGEVVIIFSETVNGFDQSDVTVQGGTLVGLTQQPDGSWKGQVVADGTSGTTGQIDVVLADGSYTDLAGNAGKGSSVIGANVPSVDTTAPNAAITVDADGNVVVTFSEAVKGFDPNDVKVTGGKLLNLVQQPDGSWTGKVVADGATGASGSVKLDIPAASYTDIAGNPGTAATAAQSVPSVDTTGPTPTLTLDANGNLVIKFSEPVKGFDATDVKVSNGSISGLTQQPDGSWTGKVVANGATGAAANVVVSIADGTYTDLAGNAGKGGFVFESIPSVDTTAPTSAIVLDANGNLTIGFSEAVKGFDANDVKVTGGTVSGLTQQPDGSWTGKVVAAGNTGALGKVTVDVADNSYTDLAGNNGKGSTASKDIPSVDTTPPSATITVGANGEVTISFSEPVKGFDAQDVQVTGGTLTGLTQQPDGSWKGQVVANGTTGSPGLVDLKIPAGSYTDNAGNPGKEATVAQSVPSLDTTAPSATIAVDAAGNVTVSFSEPVKGFDKSDLKVAGGTLQDLVEQPDGSWKGHVVANDPTGTPAKVDLSITAGSYTDTAGNLGTAASQSQTVPSIDITAPSSIITLSPNGDITISFSEPVKGFDATDVKVAGGTLISLTAQPDGTWTGKVATNGNTGASSSVAVEVVANSYTDLAGNLGKGATAVQTVPSIDTAAPTSVTTLDAAGNLKITFSEAVKGFDANDVKVTGGTVSGLTQQPDGSWTGKVVAAGNTGALGKVTVDIADNSYTDLAGNKGKGSTASKDVPSVDSTPPEATISIAPNGDVTISFSEPVKGFDAADVKVAGGTISGLTQQPDGSWKGHAVSNDPAGAPGKVDITIDAGSYTDNAGNAGKAASGSLTVPGTDTTAPTSSMVLDKAGNLTITFTEVVKDFTLSDLVVTGGTVSALTQQTNGTWTAKVTTAGNTGGSVKVDLADSSYTDLAGNAGKGSSVQQSVDSTAPSAAITLDTQGNVIVSFSEKVTDFDPSDLKVTGAIVKDLTEQADGTWKGAVQVPTVGVNTPVNFEISAGSYEDVSGNKGLEVKLDTIVYPPTVEIDPFDFFAAAPVMKFAARTLLAAEPLPPATNNPKQTFNGSSANSVEVKINLYDSSNNIVESGLAVLNTATGRWSYTPAKPLANGQFRLEAISKDIYGVTSAPANIKFIIDTVKPTIDIDDAGAVSDATPSFSGKTEANATVTVTVKDATDKVLASGAAAVAADGSWTYATPNLADGTYTVEAVAKDRAGNLSAPDSTSVTVDTVTQLDALTVTANPDGTATVSGKAEAGATVTVKDPNGNNLTVTVNADGTFSATAPAPATEGIYTAATTDAVGNTASATANLDDNVAPVIVNLDVTPNTDGTATVTGRTEIGSTVTLKDPNGKDVPVTVNPDGTFTATVPAPAAEGAYTATATDPAGNAGTATDELDDNIAPAVTMDVVSNPDGSATITGKSEPGSTVTLKDPNGKDVPVTVNPDGTYTAIVPATAAEGTYTATAKDPAGNAGTASDSLADTTAPSMLTAQVDAKTGGFVTGVAQAGSAITVYTDDGKTVLGTGTANASGQYSVTLKPAQVDGENVNVTARDPDGESAPVKAAAPDLYAPDAPTALVAVDGKSVNGVTEPNADITVYGGSKGTTVIGTAVAGADGKYTVALNPALVDGESVKVTAKDPGGESLATPVQAPDLYAPNAPVANFNAKGDSISGTAEANADIKVYAQDGKTVIAQGKSDASGNYSIKLPSAYSDGQTLLVSASDAGGESGKTGAKAPNVQLDAADNLVSASINFDYPVTENSSIKLFSHKSVVDICAETYSSEFTIGENQVGNAVISVSTSSLVNLFDIAIMKLYVKGSDGSWKLIGANKDAGLLDLLGLFNEGTQVKANNLQTGTYKFEFTGGAKIGFLTSVNASLALAIKDTSKDPAVSGVTESHGNVVTDHDSIYGKDSVPAGSAVTAVNGQSLNASGSTVIVGDHGVLTIAKDGTYSYKPNADAVNIGKSEVFGYTVTDPATGKTDTASLIIHIGTQSDLAVEWDAAHPKADATTVVATDNSNSVSFDASNAVSSASASAISYSWLFGVGNTKSGTSKFTVADGTFEDVKISFGSTQVASLLGGTVINVYDKVGKLVATTSASTLIDVITLLPNGNSLSISGLKAGEYTIKALTNTGLSFAGKVNATISRTITDLEDFTAKSTGTAAKGNIFTDNNGSGTDVLASKYTDLYISKDGGKTYAAVSKAGLTVQGDHGQLTIKSDGSYSYSVTDGKAVSGTLEDFSYKLVAPNGDSSVASLTISAGLNYTGSIGSDKITSTNGNDTVTSKAGADTLIFKLLNSSDAAGGNGHDSWNDFKKAEGDKIDVSKLLQGQNIDKSNIGQFISVAADGKGNTVISIDRDGTAGKTYNKVELLTLKNTDIGLQELLDNNHLVY